VHAAVEAYVGTLCGQPGLTLMRHARLEDIVEMDSLKWIETIAVLEEEFGVAIDTRDLEELLLLDHVVDMLARARPRN